MMDVIDTYTILADMFSNKSKEVIENIIQIVEENSQHYSCNEEKIEIMVNLLSESGVGEDMNSTSNEFLDEAAGLTIDGFSLQSPEEVSASLNFSHGSEDEVSATLNRLLDIFPDADPSYLEANSVKLAYNEQKLEDFINNHLENKDYPTMEDYLKKKSEQSEMHKYLLHFKSYQFLLEFPDPITHFSDPDRNHAFSNLKDESFEIEMEFVLKCFYNQFTYLRESDIQKVFKICDKNVIRTYNKLKTIPHAFKIPRGRYPFSDISINNVPLLQEIAFIQHEKEFALMKQRKEENIQLAKKLGLLESCKCCYTEDLIPEECILCRNGCIFCRDCVRRAAEIAYADGKTEFSCITNCGSDYTLTTLQMVLNPKTLSNLCHSIQMKEINKAAIDEIEYCPLCSDFAMIPDPNDKIFHCDNCKKDSCRLCRHESHVPLRCNEIEYDEDVKMRTYIEDKMTEALVRKCYQCGNTFIKDTGCNKMTCSCGARMCYLCGAQIKDYSHFSNAGCPLFTNDNQIHFNDVMKGANAAKAELGVDVNPQILKFDPTQGFVNPI